MVAERPVAVLPQDCIDLRAFVADPEAGVRSTEAGDPWFSARRMVTAPGGPVAIGALALSGSGQVDTLPGDEFVFVVDGTLTIGDLTLGRDRSAMLPGGISFAWAAAADTQVVVMRVTGGMPGASAPVAIDLSPTRVPSNPPAAELLLSDAPQCHNHTDYKSSSGKFSAGTWASTPYHRRNNLYPHCELMHLMEGSVTFEDAAGTAHRFVADDLFVVLRGARCSWLSEEDVVKVWAIYRPVE
ncbi:MULTISPECIES: cupin domain-containing protein [unclassified Sphingomonas]|uniref:cupin domain-containing protein n=1 Tax=unclassified Sphingomonas TaxID=196159 RepID=UPI0006FD8977|nr:MULTISPECIES: cupin domain-containing protein [unclassified Sphingomonas]KQM66766.1 hypothetical protein ASE65_01380 [Sphingomonas sp. Leaf16]KQN17714.1 hypothetical protein ASE81_00760 [Sphingomonas sp. Leaf29]KQN23576.1 hypothetical protein ASE83_03640 [Sphingomonas sp. Leaf32]